MLRDPAPSAVCEQLRMQLDEAASSRATLRTCHASRSYAPTLDGAWEHAPLRVSELAQWERLRQAVGHWKRLPGESALLRRCTI